MNTNQKIVNGSFVGVSLIAWLFFRQLIDTLWGAFKLRTPQDLPFTPADAIAVVIAVAVFILLKKQKKINDFCGEVIVELSKVTYPPKKETFLSTIVISIMVAICAVILFAFDTLWGTLVKMLYQ